MLTYLALILAVAAVFAAWISNRKNGDLKERLAQTNSRIYQLRRQIEEKQQQAEQERMALKFELLKLQGNLQVTPEMKIGEVMAVHPQAQQVLADFHIGGCSSCAVNPEQSLGEAVALNGREIEPVLVTLNSLITNGSNGSPAPETMDLRTPNIQLHI